MPALVTCEQLRALIDVTPNRVALLILLRNVEGNEHGEIQFVTYGKSAEDKSEAHNLKEWVQDEVFHGEVPEARIHESFILDAAKVKEENDRLKADNAALRAVVELADRLRCELLSARIIEIGDTQSVSEALMDLDKGIYALSLRNSTAKLEIEGEEDHVSDSNQA